MLVLWFELKTKMQIWLTIIARLFIQEMSYSIFAVQLLFQHYHKYRNYVNAQLDEDIEGVERGKRLSKG